MKDEAAHARAHAIFDPIAVDFLRREGVDIGPMFGSEGLRIRGKVFAFAGFDASLIVKLPRERIDALEAEGVAERMVMRDRPMKEWALVGPDAAEHWRPVVEEAFAFVDGITP